MAQEQAALLYKIVILGDSGVGKSNIVTRFYRNQFCLETRTTIGVDIVNKDVNFHGTKITLQLWDTAGQERFRAVSPGYYRGADAALLVYDITKHESFESITRWLKELRFLLFYHIHSPYLEKSHLREVTVAEGQALAKSNSLSFMETSAMNAVNIEEVFDHILQVLRGGNPGPPEMTGGEAEIRSGGVTLGQSQTPGGSSTTPEEKSCC
ncbi:Ran GTPase [Pelomyxa schiedti]|nr:Ran GTPase [Pelomyxa schiedti]